MALSECGGEKKSHNNNLKLVSHFHSNHPFECNWLDVQHPNFSYK